MSRAGNHQGCHDGKSAVQRADQALYLAKSARRDRIATLARETELAGKTA